MWRPTGIVSVVLAPPAAAVTSASRSPATSAAARDRRVASFALQRTSAVDRDRAVVRVERLDRQRERRVRIGVGARRADDQPRDLVDDSSGTAVATPPRATCRSHAPGRLPACSTSSASIDRDAAARRRGARDRARRPGRGRSRRRRARAAARARRRARRCAPAARRAAPAARAARRCRRTGRRRPAARRRRRARSRRSASASPSTRATSVAEPPLSNSMRVGRAEPAQQRDQLGPVHADRGRRVAAVDDDQRERAVGQARRGRGRDAAVALGVVGRARDRRPARRPAAAAARRRSPPRRPPAADRCRTRAVTTSPTSGSGPNACAAGPYASRSAASAGNGGPLVTRGDAVAAWCRGVRPPSGCRPSSATPRARCAGGDRAEGRREQRGAALAAASTLTAVIGTLTDAAGRAAREAVGLEAHAAVARRRSARRAGWASGRARRCARACPAARRWR